VCRWSSGNPLPWQGQLFQHQGKSKN